MGGPRYFVRHNNMMPQRRQLIPQRGVEVSGDFDRLIRQNVHARCGRGGEYARAVVDNALHELRADSS